MTRVLSAAVLLPILIGTVWFLPPIGTLVLAEIAALLAFVEYATPGCGARHALSRGSSSGAAVLAACASVGIGSQCDRDRPADRARDDQARSPLARHAQVQASWPTQPRRCSRCCTSACRSARWRPSGVAGRDAVALLAVGIIVSDYGAVLHRPRVRPSPAGAGHQSRRRPSRARSAASCSGSGGDGAGRPEGVSRRQVSRCSC